MGDEFLTSNDNYDELYGNSHFDRFIIYRPMCTHIIMGYRPECRAKGHRIIKLYPTEAGLQLLLNNYLRYLTSITRKIIELE